MTSKGDKRHTQLDFSRLRNFWGVDSSGGPESSPSRQVSPGRRSNPVPEIEKEEIETTQDAGKEPVRQEVRRTSPSVAAKEGSPFDYYEEMYALRLGLGYRAIVAEERFPTELANVYSIRQFTASDIKTQQVMFQDIRHQNFVPAREIFWSGNICHVVFEHMPCSLYEVRGNEHLNELRLAAVIGQASAPLPVGAP